MQWMQILPKCHSLVLTLIINGSHLTFHSHRWGSSLPIFAHHRHGRSALHWLEQKKMVGSVTYSCKQFLDIFSILPPIKLSVGGKEGSKNYFLLWNSDIYVNYDLRPNLETIANLLLLLMWSDWLCEFHKTLYHYNKKGFYESKLAKGVKLKQF